MNEPWYEAWLTWLPELLPGLWISVMLAVVSMLVGSFFGLLLAVMALSERRGVRITAMVIVEIGRGTPALVVLQLVYFGLPPAGLSLGAFTAAAVAFSLTAAAYTSEILRGGLQAVPDGEVEASAALGMSRTDAMRFIVVPQGVRIAVPPLINFTILMFQATSLAFVIGLQELLSRAYVIGSNTFRFFEVLALAGVLYLVITIPGTWLSERAERRLSRHL